MHSAHSRLARGADKCTANMDQWDPTDPTVRCPSCGANGCLSRILQSPKVHCCIPSLKTAPFPQPDKPTPHHLYNTLFNIIVTMSKPSPVVSCLKRFLSNIMYITPIASMCATRPAHLNLFCLSNVVTLLRGRVKFKCLFIARFSPAPPSPVPSALWSPTQHPALKCSRPSGYFLTLTLGAKFHIPIAKRLIKDLRVYSALHCFMIFENTNTQTLNTTLYYQNPNYSYMFRFVSNHLQAVRNCIQPNMRNWWVSLHTKKQQQRVTYCLHFTAILDTLTSIYSTI